MRYAFLFFFLAGFLFAGAGCPVNEQGDTVDYEDDVKPLIEEVDDEYKVRGSCNVIAEKSTCIDYVGSFWNDDQMGLNCKGVGEYSRNTCPYSELGGCAATPGTATEIVTWFYATGGQAMDATDAYYASEACNAGPISNWVGPDYYFQ